MSSWRRPQPFVRSFVDAAEFDERYGVVEEVLKELGHIPDPDALAQKVRDIGIELVSLELPCQQIAHCESSTPDARTLAEDVLERVEELRDQVATLSVDLQEIRIIADIAQSGKGEVINARGRSSSA